MVPVPSVTLAVKPTDSPTVGTEFEAFAVAAGSALTVTETVVAAVTFTASVTISSTTNTPARPYSSAGATAVLEPAYLKSQAYRIGAARAGTVAAKCTQNRISVAATGA